MALVEDAQNYLILLLISDKIKSLGNWNDLFCDAKTCAICDMKTAPVFEMRGLCYGTSFDRHFGWNGVRDPETEQYSFPGFSKSMLQVDSFQKDPFVHHIKNMESKQFDYLPITQVIHKLNKQ